MLFMCSFTQQVRWGDVSDYWTLPQHSTPCSEKTEIASRHMISCGWSSEHSSLILWLWTCSRNDYLTTVLLHNTDTDDWEAFSEKEWQYWLLIKVYMDRKLSSGLYYIELGWDTEKMSFPAHRPCVPCITLLYILPIPSLSIIQGQNVPPLWQSGGSLTFSCWIFQSW